MYPLLQKLIGYFEKGIKNVMRDNLNGIQPSKGSTDCVLGNLYTFRAVGKDTGMEKFLAIVPDYGLEIIPSPSDFYNQP